VTKRLQVLLDDNELAEIQRLARRRRMTVAAWVRESLRAARAAEPGPTTAAKLEALHRATSWSLPVGDIDELLAEIERGYQGDLIGPPEP
jgi:hypothetical protein